MEIRDLGRLSGPVLLYGGPYSNLSATEALLAVAAEIPMENRICTGDVVAYAARPRQVIDRIRAAGGTVVAGNCEQQLGAHADACGCGFEGGSACDLLSRGWYSFADAAVTEEDRAWMRSCPDVAVFEHGGKRFGVIHGGVTEVSRFLWPTSDAAAFQEEKQALEAELGPVDAVIAGHAGIAFQRGFDGWDWINAGVIGMAPNDGSSEGRYVVLGETGPVIHRLPYDAEAERAAMVAAGLTQGYHDALTSGWWPSEDVLPEALRRQSSAASG